MFAGRFKKVFGYIVATSLKLMGDVLMGQKEMLAEMQDNYGRAGVTYLILSAAQKEPLDETMIAKAVGLDVDVVDKYLECMVENDLLSSNAEGYVTTSYGDTHCAAFEEVLSLLPLKLIK